MIILKPSLCQIALSTLRFDSDKQRNAFQGALMFSPSFEFDNDLDTCDLYEAGLDALQNGLFPAPDVFFYYETNIEAHTRIGILAQYLSQTSRIIFTVCGRVDGADKKLLIGEVTREGVMGEPENDDFLNAVTWLCGRKILSFTMALKCKDVLVSDVRPSASVARKRASKGQEPIIEFKKVTIRTDLKTAYALAASTFDRSGPRLHFRRGHVRRLPTGRETYVSPCYVGNLGNGAIVKSYEVK